MLLYPVSLTLFKSGLSAMVAKMWDASAVEWRGSDPYDTTIQDSLERANNCAERAHQVRAGSTLPIGWCLQGTRQWADWE